jgi:predicted ATP-binding protein involved in virulence
MNDTFITRIHIDKVRHLETLDIPLSGTELKHLILTGKNGSGKTSLLEAIRDNFYMTTSLRHSPDQPIGESDIFTATSLHIQYATQEKNLELAFFYFPAERQLLVDKPTAIEKIDAEHSKDILKKMLILDYQKVSATVNKEQDKERHIQQWFDNFTQMLRTFLECPELTLDKDAENLDFKINLHRKSYEPVDFNSLPDGFSSILAIVIELMTQMERNTNGDYTVPGIVLIDEIETHLHVSLQKKALPMLSAMFPNIQFIVTTHSPFVTESLKGAVVYDLELKKHRIIDEVKSYDEVIRDDMGVDAIMPLWAEQNLNRIVEKYIRLDNNELSLDAFKNELKEAGLSEYFPISVSKVLEGR